MSKTVKLAGRAMARPHTLGGLRRGLARTTIVIAGLCVMLLAGHSPAGAQDCPPAVKAMVPPNGTVRSCAYLPLATTLSVQFSGDVPRPDLPDQPYVFSLKINRMKSPALARRIDTMAQAEIAKTRVAKASEQSSIPTVHYGPVQEKAIAGGNAWYRKVSLASIGESPDTPIKVYYDCEYYVVDGTTLIRFEATAADTAQADAWFGKIRTGVQTVQ